MRKLNATILLLVGSVALIGLGGCEQLGQASEYLNQDQQGQDVERPVVQDLTSAL